MAPYQAMTAQQAKPIRSPTHSKYQARRGESLDAIALRHGLSTLQLRAANDSVKLDKKGRLRAAGPVLVPMRMAGGMPPASPQPARVAALSVPTASAGGTTRSVAVAAATHAPGSTYVVRAGDTLYAIAKRFNTAVETLLALNKLSARSILQPGLRLKLP